MEVEVEVEVWREEVGGLVWGREECRITDSQHSRVTYLCVYSTYLVPIGLYRSA